VARATVLLLVVLLYNVGGSSYNINSSFGDGRKRFVRGDIDENTEGKIMTKKMDRMKLLSKQNKKERNIEF
jgi:hypothetical protein